MNIARSVYEHCTFQSGTSHLKHRELDPLKLSNKKGVPVCTPFFRLYRSLRLLQLADHDLVMPAVSTTAGMAAASAAGVTSTSTATVVSSAAAGCVAASAVAGCRS
jgi:hypothetical protein